MEARHQVGMSESDACQLDAEMVNIIGVVEDLLKQEHKQNVWQEKIASGVDI